MNKRYNNYHKHSHISSLFGGVGDSNVKQSEYIDRCIELGHTNFFTTEHGTFGDIFEAFDLSHKNNLRCLPGLEGYIVVDNNPELKDRSNYHIMILPITDNARKKCNYYNSLAHMEGFYYKPRWSLNYLYQFKREELYITTACSAGLLRDECGIEHILTPLIHRFGDHVLLEVQNHQWEFQKEINRKAVSLSNALGLKLCAANDSHYIYPSQAKERHDLMVGKRQLNNPDSYGNKLLPSETKYQMDMINAEDEFILDFPDYDEFFTRFVKQKVLNQEQIESAINNTLLFDELEEIQLDYEIKMPNIYPNIPLQDRMKILEDMVWQKFEETKIKEHISDEDLPKYIDGINYELQIIRDTNEQIHTCDYFLFNTRNVDLAVNKYKGVLTRGGRGSCASFYTNKLLGMTQLDRFKINLPIFPDRFASTARLLDNRALPDIDFNCMEQEPFVKASKELLGENGCFPMVAYGTMQEGEAFRNVCRSHGLQFDEFNEVAKNLDAHREDKKWKDLIAEAQHYVGTIVSGSVHPCAHVLSDKDLLWEYGVAKFGDYYCVMITSNEADQFKVLKNDYLIVSVWKLIYETFKEIGEPIIDAHELLDKIKNDERVWALFANGITCTLNQVDSDNGMQQAKTYGIKSFEDGALIAAAIRPSFDAWRPKFLHHEDYSTGSKDLDQVLQQTQHYILFQENLMQYFDWLGVTPAESIGLIKKISKKKIKPEDFEKLEERLRENWIKQTGSNEMFDETWKMIQGCMAYGFASPHAAATSLDMCYGAYLKVNYPFEYMTVCLNNYAGDAERTAKLKRELEYFNIKLGRIKFGHSKAEYSYDKSERIINKGIGSIKYLNNTVANELYDISHKNTYTNFVDLLEVISNESMCNTKQLDILIRLGYFSDFGEVNELLFITKYFQALYDKVKGYKKQIKKSSAQKKELNIDIIAQYSVFKPSKTNPDDGNFGELRTKELLLNLKYTGKPRLVSDIIKDQQEFLSYIDYTDPKENPMVVCVTKLNTTYSPTFTAYRLKDGGTFEFKVHKSRQPRDPYVMRSFRDTPFENGDILLIKKWDKKPRCVKDSAAPNGWRELSGEYVWWLTDYERM